MRKNRLRHGVLGLATAAAVAVPASMAMGAPIGDWVTVKPAANPSSVNPKQEIHRGTPGPDALGSAGVSQCSDGPRLGTERLADYIEHWWPRGESWGIYNCRYISGTTSYSLHAGGRAYDHHLEASNPDDKAAGDSLVAGFLRADSAGNKYALAKRFGVQEIIWNCKIWTADRASEGLRSYGACPTSNDTVAHRDHVHIGQNLRGAGRDTTAYTAWNWCAPDGAVCP